MRFWARLGDQGQFLRRAITWKRFKKRHSLRMCECGLIVQQGIGDHFLVCAFAKAVERVLGCKVIIAGHSQNAFMADLFSGVARFIALPRVLENREFGAYAPTPGDYAYGHFRGYELTRAFGYRGFHLLDAYRCLLGLNDTERLDLPRQPTQLELQTARSYLEANGLPPGSTVILSPQARSTPTVNIRADFWLQVGSALQQLGLSPAVNAWGKNQASTLGFPTIEINLKDFRAVVSAAGYFLGTRSGLCDLICDLDCNKCVLYPDAPYRSGTVYNVANFTQYGLRRPPAEKVIKDGDPPSPKELEALIGGMGRISV